MAAEEFEEKETQGFEKGFNFEEFGMLLLSKWHWFLLAVLIALSAAVYRILKTTPIYTRTTSLLIKDESNGGSSTTKEFEDLGIISGRSNISNEIQTISASSLMMNAVKSLGLDLQMNVPQRLHERVIYNDAPVILTKGNDIADNAAFSFKMKVIEGQKVRIYDFAGKNLKASDVRDVPFGGTLKLSVGSIKIDVSPAYGSQWIGQEIMVRKYPLQAVGNQYAGRLGVSQTDDQSTILQLTLIDEVPERADDVLKALIDAYNEDWIADKNKVAESTSEFITQRLNTLTKELGDVDRDISDYKSQNLLPDVQAAAGQYMTQSSTNYNSMLDLNNQLSMAQYLLEALNNTAGTNQLLPANTLGNAGAESQISAYNELMLKRNALLANSSEQNRYVQDYDEQLRAQRTAIVRTLNNMIAQINAQIGNVQQSESETNQKIAASPKQARQLLSVERQQKVKESLYIYLLQKREENELSKAYTAWNTRVIQAPTGAPGPSYPNKFNIMALAFIIGLAIPAAYIFLREFFNKSVRGRKDLEGMETPFIGEIPTLNKKRHWWNRRKQQTREIVVESGNRNMINESFRIIRTKLDFFLSSESTSKVVMLTSFNPGSGKTFISSNLSRTISLKGKRVLAIDFDLRRCSLTFMLKKRYTRGLSTYLSGQESNVEDLILPNAFGENVDVLPSGAIPPNPTELLLSENMKNLIDWAREHYDYVILDCPPIEIVADASIIKNYADATIFVVRVGLMDRRMLKDVEEIYKSNKYNNMSLLLNDVHHATGRYGRYGYNYGYSYGYGYGYGRHGEGSYGYYGKEKK